MACSLAHSELEEAQHGDSVAWHTAALRKKDSGCSSIEYMPLLDSHTNEVQANPL